VEPPASIALSAAAASGSSTSIPFLSSVTVTSPLNPGAGATGAAKVLAVAAVLAAEVRC